MPDPPDSMTETTKDCSSNDTIFAIFSNLDANLRSLGLISPDKLVPLSSPVVSIDPEVMVTSPQNSLATYLPNSASTNEQYSPDPTSTIEASDNDITVEVPTADIQLLTDNSNEEQHEPPPAYSFPTEISPVLSRPNQFKHRAETANLVNSRK